jgi:hypothetical protein
LALWIVETALALRAIFAEAILSVRVAMHKLQRGTVCRQAFRIGVAALVNCALKTGTRADRGVARVAGPAHGWRASLVRNAALGSVDRAQKIFARLIVEVTCERNAAIASGADIVEHATFTCVVVARIVIAGAGVRVARHAEIRALRCTALWILKTTLRCGNRSKRA